LGSVCLFDFLANLIWQARNHFISLDFLSHIHARDVRMGRTKNFLFQQLQLTLLGFLVFSCRPLFHVVFRETTKRFRMLGWMYLVPLALFVIAKAVATTSPEHIPMFIRSWQRVARTSIVIAR